MPRGPYRRARSRAWSRHAQARSGTPPGPRGAPARSVRGSSGGTSMPTRIWSRPASSRMKPESAPESAGPRRASGGSGGGPDAGATSRKLTTPVVVGDPHQRHPPAVWRLGRARHPGSERAISDADLVLAQVRRSGRWESIGHGRKSTRPSGSGRLTVPVGQRVGIERLVDVVELGADLLEVLDDGFAAAASSGVASGARPSTVASAMRASASACRFATSASSASRSISRRTSASGGASAPASAALGVSSGYSPADPATTGGCAAGHRVLARTMAAASMRSGPAGRHPSRDRRPGRHRRMGMCRAHRYTSPSTTGRRSPRARSPHGCRRPWAECYRALQSPEYPIGPGCARYRPIAPSQASGDA